MFPGILLSLREGLEAVLILSIVLGTLHKLNRSNLAKIVWGGALSAVVLSLVFAWALHRIGVSLEGQTETIYEGTMMFLAAGMLTWAIFWMKRRSRYLKSDLEASIRKTHHDGGAKALFVLAFIAVLREGLELAIFLTTATMTSGTLSVLMGALIGIVTAMLLGWLLFFGLIRLNLQGFFLTTSVLLLLFAAGLVAHGIHEFNEIGWIPALVEHVWDVNPWLDEESILGQMLKTLFGYNGNPSLSEVLGYLLYLGAVIWGMRRESPSLVAPQKI